MKIILVLACAIVSCTAFADMTKPCRIYEFAELNTFSNSELQTLTDKYESVIKGIASITPINAKEVREDFEGTANCKEELVRIKRLQDSRKKAEVEAENKLAAKKKK